MDWIIRALGGVPSHQHAEIIDDVRKKYLEEYEEDIAQHTRRFREAADFLREAADRSTADRIAVTDAAADAAIVNLRRLTDENLRRWEVYYATQLVRWNAHELIAAQSWRLFCCTLGCSGNGFTRGLTVAETNVREVPLPPLAIRGVSVTAWLAQPINYTAEQNRALTAALHSALRRRATLTIDLPQVEAVVGPLDQFDLEHGGVRAWSPPEEFERELARSPRGWDARVDVRELRIPEEMAFCLRIKLHGERLRLPEVARDTRDIVPLGPARTQWEPPLSEEVLRRVVREEVRGALSNRKHSRPM